MAAEDPCAMPGGFGLYIHWPFCAAKCPYCDFNSHVVDAVDTDRWRRAFLAALDDAARETGGRRLDSIFFGGGTPSLMSPDLVGDLIAAAQHHWPAAPDQEVTLEANPSSVEAGRFSGYRDAGVNRISIGVQSLRDEDLRRLGRLHSAAAALRAVEVASRSIGRVSIDLIYARQHQNLRDWRAELREALALGAEHLSLYQLTIEPGTAFGARMARGRLPGLPDDDLAAEMFETTQELCEAHGRPAYEVSNHAAPGCEGRHNLVYWRCGDYLGIGPGAHGRLTLDGTRWATETEHAPSRWLSMAEAGRQDSARTKLSAAEQAEEYLMMALRLTEGVDLSRLHRLGFRPDAARIATLEELGLVHARAGRITATSSGRIVLNGILRELVAETEAA